MITRFRAAPLAAIILIAQIAGSPASSQPSQQLKVLAQIPDASDKEVDQFSGFPTYGDPIDCTPNHWITPNQQSFDAHSFSEQMTCAVERGGTLRACHLVVGQGYSTSELTWIGVCLASYLQAKKGDFGSAVSFHIRYKPAAAGQPGYIYYPANPNR